MPTRAVPCRQCDHRELCAVPDCTAAAQLKVSSGRVVSLGVWDTAGAERFESLSRMCVPTSCTVPPASPCYTALVKACTVLPSCPRNQATLQQLVWLLPGSSTGSPAAAARRYYNGARAAIVCFNPADRLSFEKAKFWVRELRDTQVRPRPAWRAGRHRAGRGGGCQAAPRPCAARVPRVPGHDKVRPAGGPASAGPAGRGRLWL